ncbi:MAG: P1 family peptidase [Pseudomonadota bacterium]
MSGLSALGGCRIGHADDGRTGATAVVFDPPVQMGVAVHGGAPGTRETDLLRPGHLNPPVDALTLCGGSAFGLAAADGAQATLLAAGRGFAVGAVRVPIVPGAIIFDLVDAVADYRALGANACAAALLGDDEREGSVGAGVGATTATVRGGLGLAVEQTKAGGVGALVVNNAVGSPIAANGPWFRAAPFERDAEFGGLVAPPHADFARVETKLARAGEGTVIALIVTDATLDTAALTGLARGAHDGIALGIYPAHTLLDGDTVFAASTARRPPPAGLSAHVALGAAATRALTRALTRAVVHATPASGPGPPAWSTRFPTRT